MSVTHSIIVLIFSILVTNILVDSEHNDYKIDISTIILKGGYFVNNTCCPFQITRENNVTQVTCIPINNSSCYQLYFKVNKTTEQGEVKEENINIACLRKRYKHTNEMKSINSKPNEGSK